MRHRPIRYRHFGQGLVLPSFSRFLIPLIQQSIQFCTDRLLFTSSLYRSIQQEIGMSAVMKNKRENYMEMAKKMLGKCTLLLVMKNNSVTRLNWA
jgi:hypothetical protein